MAETIKNSSFKIKVEKVPVINGLIPEKGALVFNEADGQVYLGDGFNWVTFESSTLGAAVTGSSFDNTMAGGVPVVTAEYFDAVLYNRGSAMTISIPAQTVTIDTDGTYQINWIFNAQSTVPQVTLTFSILLNDVSIGSFAIFMPTKNQAVSSSGTVEIPGLVGTDVLTIDMVTNKNCDLTRFGQNVGISKI